MDKYLFLTNVNLKKISGASEHVKGFLYGLKMNNIKYIYLSLDKIIILKKPLYYYPKLLQIFFYHLYSLFYIFYFHREYNILYIRYSPLVFLQIILGKVSNKKIILEVNGEFKSEIDLLFNIPDSILLFLNFLYKYSLKNAYKIITVSNGIKEGINKNYRIKKNKIIIVPNGAYKNTVKIRNEFSNKGVCIFSNVSWYSIDDIIDLKNKLLNKKINMDIYFSEQTTKYRDIVISGKLFKGGDYDWGLLIYNSTKSKNIINAGVRPIKYFTYLSYGIPVIIPNISDINIITLENNVGYIYYTFKEETIINTIVKLYEDKEKWIEMQKNAYKIIREKYNWEKIVGVLISKTKCSILKI